MACRDLSLEFLICTRFPLAIEQMFYRVIRMDGYLAGDFAEYAEANENVVAEEDWEQIRRSVAMLPAGSWAMRREQALVALNALAGAHSRS